MSKTAKEILTEMRLDGTYWGRRIIAAEDRGRCSLRDIRKARDWTTCACGKADPRIPRSDIDNQPLDPFLGFLGGEFTTCIEEHRFRDAAGTLATIEFESCRLLGKNLPWRLVE